MRKFNIKQGIIKYGLIRRYVTSQTLRKSSQVNETLEKIKPIEIKDKLELELESNENYSKKMAYSLKSKQHYSEYYIDLIKDEDYKAFFKFIRQNKLDIKNELKGINIRQSINKVVDYNKTNSKIINHYFFLNKSITYEEYKLFFIALKKQCKEMDSKVYQLLTRWSLEQKDWKFYYLLLECQFKDGYLLRETQLASISQLPEDDRIFMYNNIGIKLIYKFNLKVFYTFLSNNAFINLERNLIYKQLRDNTSFGKFMEKERYNMLIIIMSKTYNCALAEYYYNLAIEKGYKLNSFSYTNLLKLYCNAGYGIKALNLWNSIPNKHQSNYSVAACIILDNCYINLDLKTLNLLWDQINQCDSIGINHFTSYIEGLIKFKQYELAVSLFEKLCNTEFNVEPDYKTFRNLAMPLRALGLNSNDTIYSNWIRRTLLAYNLYKKKNNIKS